MVRYYLKSGITWTGRLRRSDVKHFKKTLSCKLVNFLVDNSDVFEIILSYVDPYWCCPENRNILY